MIQGDAVPRHQTMVETMMVTMVLIMPLMTCMVLRSKNQENPTWHGVPQMRTMYTGSVTLIGSRSQHYLLTRRESEVGLR